MRRWSLNPAEGTVGTADGLAGEDVFLGVPPFFEEDAEAEIPGRIDPEVGLPRCGGEIEVAVQWRRETRGGANADVAIVGGLCRSRTSGENEEHREGWKTRAAEASVFITTEGVNRPRIGSTCRVRTIRLYFTGDIARWRRRSRSDGRTVPRRWRFSRPGSGVGRDRSGRAPFRASKKYSDGKFPSALERRTVFRKEAPVKRCLYRARRVSPPEWGRIGSLSGKWRSGQIAGSSEQACSSRKRTRT